MTTEVIYDEAEPFQTYSPALQSPHDIYSNSGEFDVMVDYSNSDDGRGACTAAVQPLNESRDIATDKRSTSCSGTPVDGISFLDEVVKELEAKQQEGSNETASRDIPVSWNVKLRNNWKRKLRRDAAAATEQKYKKSDNRQTITGSLSRLFGKASHRLSLPNLTNLSIFKSDSADVDGDEIDADQQAAIDDSDFDDDDDRDDGLWSDTEFDVEEPEPELREENLYANIDDCIRPSDVTREAEVRWSTEERPARDAALTYLRHHDPYRKRPTRSHAIAVRHKTASESAAQQVLAGSSDDVRRKPPVAARPAALRTNTASTSPSQRRQTCPPSTLDISTVHVVERPSSAGASETVAQVEVNQPVRTDSCASTSSGDVDSSSGDSATSGFSSAGSDVTKATGSTDENETMTLGRPAAKRQKPALKPKPRLNDNLITMTLNRRPMRPLVNRSGQQATSDTQTASPPVPRPRPHLQPSDNAPQSAAPPVPQPRPFSPLANDIAGRASLVASVLSAPGPSQTAHVDDADDEGCESDRSYAKKPLPPVKSARTGRVFNWRRSHSVENIPQDDTAAANAPPKTTPTNKDATGNVRLRGKAIMPDLSKLMLHRIAGDLKSKAARNKDQETTNPGAAVPKLQAMKTSSPEPTDVGQKPSTSPLAIALPQLETQPWYFDAEDKYDCEQKVRAVGQDGAFLVRRRQTDTDGCPYALTLAFDGQVYHMLIRRRDNGKFSLGADRPNQHVFNSVVELVCFYANNAIHLTIDKNSGAVLGKVQLTASPTR